MKKNKGLIIIVIILVVYAIIMVLIFGSGNSAIDNASKARKETEASKSNSFIVIDNLGTFRYKDNVFVSTANQDIKDEDFNVYVNNEYLGVYNLKLGKVWNLFSNGNYKEYEGSLLAATEDIKFNVLKPSIKDLSDSDKYVLENSFNINNFDYLKDSKVYNVDLDNNGVEDEIIVLNNYDYSSDNLGSYYNIILVKLNNEIKKVLDVRGVEAQNNIYTLEGIFKIDDNVASLAINKLEGVESDDSKNVVSIYKYIDNKYTNN